MRERITDHSTSEGLHMSGTRRIRRISTDNGYAFMGGNRHGANAPRWAERYFGVLVGTYPGQWLIGVAGLTCATLFAIFRAIGG